MFRVSSVSLTWLRLCLAFSLASPFCLSATAQGLPPAVVGALRVAHIPQQNTGVLVLDAQTGTQTLVQQNVSQPFNPASVMKLVTTDAALDLLGPTYTWKTQAYIDGSLAGGVLNGDLVIKGGGDPKLVLENVWLFLRQLRARGLREIRGNLVLDRSFFAQSTYDPAQFDGDPQKPYNAGPDALLLNYKTITLRFVPDAASGSVQTSIDPPMSAQPLNPPRLSQEACGDDWQARLGLNLGQTGEASFSGSYAAACGERVWYLHPAQMSHVQYAAAMLRQMWSELGGSLSGQVLSGVASPAAQLFGQWQSPALPEVIRDINKYSNNVMARQVLLTLAAETSGQPGDTVIGARTVRAWLTAKGIDTSALAIENGAGLSRVERVTPLLLGRMLEQAWRSPLMPEFVSSLPLVGYDGTMRRRLKNDGVAGQAHIKTGTLNDVRSIAGYVQAASGKTWVVVFLINHPAAPGGQKAQDALLQWVYENG